MFVTWTACLEAALMLRAIMASNSLADTHKVLFVIYHVKSNRGPQPAGSLMERTEFKGRVLFRHKFSLPGLCGRFYHMVTEPFLVWFSLFCHHPTLPLRRVHWSNPQLHIAVDSSSAYHISHNGAKSYQKYTKQNHQEREPDSFSLHPTCSPRGSIFHCWS